ncbi:MAG TPA: SDR family oxidoreductase [Acidobacteriaceae bacterium]|jgi:L-fucose dehydrogenase|nr:SDR family oxidoreductase [Acidobacteriaceae bacterium]
MDLGLQDRQILVTGGASGIGAAITRACLAEGARVLVVSRISTGVHDFIAEMKRTNQRCEFFEAELNDLEQCRRAVQYLHEHAGQLYGLVNNAGVNDGVGLENGDPQRFQASLLGNVLHTYALTHYALPLLKASRGSVVTISSKVALTGQGGTSGYAAAKGAQLALTREWAAELLPYGIRVNAVLPAEVMTPLYESWLSKRPDPQAALQRITHQIPLGRRMTHAEEIASAVVFLLSPMQSGHTTGQHLVVDGGYVHLDRMLTAT